MQFSKIFDRFKKGTGKDADGRSNENPAVAAVESSGNVPVADAAESKDIFDKCRKFTMADEIKAEGLYPYFHMLNSRQSARVMMEGKPRIMLGSNNYLGLTDNMSVIQAGKDAIDKYGTGCSGSRYLNGNLDIHVEMERKIADFMGREDAIIFSTGYGSNLSVLSCIGGRDDYYIIDRESHASIYDGCRLAYSKMLRYKHSDMADLERILQGLPEKSGKLIVTDGLFSLGGDYANLPEIVRLAKKYGARTMVDDAHAFGVAGEGGKGTAWHFGLENEIDIITATFSKSLASLGGFVVADRKVIDFIRHTSKPFIFTASPTPSATYAAITALEYIKAHPELPKRLNDLGLYFRNKLVSLGLAPKPGSSPIVPLPSKDTKTTLLVSKMLYDEGVYVNCVFPPAVAENDCLIRTSVTAKHDEGILDEAAQIIAKTFGKLGLDRI